MRVGRFNANPIDVMLAVFLPITAIGLYVEFSGPPAPKKVIQSALKAEYTEVYPYINSDFDFMGTDNSGRTLLHAAAERGNPKLILTILTRGGHDSISAFDHRGFTPVHRAILKERPTSSEVVRAFLRNGAHPDLKSQHGESLLALALREKKFAAVSVLLKTGADPNVGLIEGQHPIIFILRSGFSHVLDDMLTAGLSPNPQPGDNSIPPLAYAIATHDGYSTRLLLEHGADPNARWKTQWIWAQVIRHPSNGRGGFRPPTLLDRKRWILSISDPWAESRNGARIGRRVPIGRGKPKKPNRKPIAVNMLPLDMALFHYRNRGCVVTLMEHGARAELFPRLLATAMRH